MTKKEYSRAIKKELQKELDSTITGFSLVPKQVKDGRFVRVFTLGNPLSDMRFRPRMSPYNEGAAGHFAGQLFERSASI
jgi:hypothetical protein